MDILRDLEKLLKLQYLVRLHVYCAPQSPQYCGAGTAAGFPLLHGYSSSSSTGSITSCASTSFSPEMPAATPAIDSASSSATLLRFSQPKYGLPQFHTLLTEVQTEGLSLAKAASGAISVEVVASGGGRRLHAEIEAACKTVHEKSVRFSYRSV